MNIETITISPTHIAVKVNGEYAGHATCRSVSALAPLRDRLWIAYRPEDSSENGSVYGNPTAAADYLVRHHSHQVR